MILGHGVDLVDVERFRELIKRQGNSFLERVFTEAERNYCERHSDPVPHYAARFAAKEAFGKALGVGIGSSQTALHEVSVDRQGNGPPKLALAGKAHSAMSALGANGVFLSLSHDGGMALASVILSKT